MKKIIIIFFMMFILTSCGEKTTIHIHNFTLEVIEVGCENDGYDRYTCECGHFYEENFVRTKGHQFGDFIQNEEEYTKYKECSECHTRIDQIDWEHADYQQFYKFKSEMKNDEPYFYLISKKDSSIIKEIKGTVINITEDPGTCQNVGHITYYSKFVISDSFTIFDNVIVATDKTDHKMSEWELYNAPQCISPGNEYRKCEYCMLYEYKEIPALGHKYNIEKTREGDILYIVVTCENEPLYEHKFNIYLDKKVIEPSVNYKGKIIYSFERDDLEFGKISYYEEVEFE